VPSPRAAHGIAKLGRQVFVFGGRHDTTRLSDLYVIDMADLFWTRSGEHIYHWHCSCLESHGADITAVIREKFFGNYRRGNGWLGYPSGEHAGLRRRRARVQITTATLSGNSLRQTVHTHRASVRQAAKLVAALLRVARVTAGLAESNGSLSPGL